MDSSSQAQASQCPLMMVSRKSMQALTSFFGSLLIAMRLIWVRKKASVPHSRADRGL